MEQEQVCDLCRGRGIITDSNGKGKKCPCTVRRELQMYLKPVLNYKLDKSLDYDKLNKSLVIQGGTELGYFSLIKSFLFKDYFQHQTSRIAYDLATPSSITEAYLSDATHRHFYDIPLLFLNLTKYYTNKVTGEVLLYTLQQRDANNLIYWVYTGNLKTAKISSAFSGEFQEHLLGLDALNIDNYSKMLITDTEEEI